MSASEPFAGTQIGPDGRRYTTGEIPDGLVDPRSQSYLRVNGVPEDGQVVWQDPETGQAGWADFDTLADFVPSSP